MRCEVRGDWAGRGTACRAHFSPDPNQNPSQIRPIRLIRPIPAFCLFSFSPLVRVCFWIPVFFVLFLSSSLHSVLSANKNREDGGGRNEGTGHVGARHAVPISSSTPIKTPRRAHFSPDPNQNPSQIRPIRPIRLIRPIWDGRGLGHHAGSKDQVDHLGTACRAPT
jgi:hypothetical protein